MGVLAAAFAVAATGATLSATPASAADNCRAGYLCLYSQTNFPAGVGAGFIVGNGVSNSDLRYAHYPENNDAVNDTVSSVINNTGHTIRLYESTGYQGRYINVPPLGRVADLRQRALTVYHNNGSIFANPGEFNDVTSSFKAL
ncbi:peptidase inhibitor family I36 protein [Actinacidiphila glaucinigra]|uniref:Peptidase inhibitor family I36 n=2 Tax=Actinacidiphila glaucinigra TaxID=235986 RepID=A0A239LNW9_9ACTN|nr:peptidase inhibitor family I36 protein [Actinacidiphila glaucinigra]SNT31324.1 Peptidase inhibitor family I36 [Actinacidiphila glaucinigra]